MAEDEIVISPVDIERTMKNYATLKTSDTVTSSFDKGCHPAFTIQGMPFLIRLAGSKGEHSLSSR